MSGDGEFGALRRRPSRSWKKDGDDSPMSCYLGMEYGRITLAELISHFEENYPHVDPMALRINFPTVVWEEPPTAEDVEKRRAVRAWHEERTASWERDTYERLKAKFGDSEAQS